MASTSPAELIQNSEFTTLPEVLKCVNPRHIDDLGTIAFLGWGKHFGPKTPFHVLNRLRQIGRGSNILLGLREGSSSIDEAEYFDFSTSSGNLVRVDEAVEEADTLVVSLPDSILLKNPDLFDKAKQGSLIVGLSGLLRVVGNGIDKFSGLNRINSGLFPKGLASRSMFPWTSIDPVDSFSRQAKLYTLASLVGSPIVYNTSSAHEFRSDLLAEAGVLIGGSLALTSVYHDYIVDQTSDHAEAYYESILNLTGPIANQVKDYGFLGIYRSLDPEKQKIFRQVYCASYPRLKHLAENIYQYLMSESGLDNLTHALMNNPDTLPDDLPGSKSYDRGEKKLCAISDEPSTVLLAIYCALHMAQINILKKHGHSWIEIISETEEALDAHKRYKLSGLSDIYSSTASTFARMWQPHYEKIFRQLLSTHFPVEDKQVFDDFTKNDFHNTFAKLKKIYT